MKRIAGLLVLFVLLACSPVSIAGGKGSGRSTSSGGHSRSSATSQPRSTPRSYAAPKSSNRNSAIKCVGCARDSHGRIQRSEPAKNSFKKSNPCPSTGKSRGACPGYDIDHRTPLAKGGTDDPSNMQWLSKGQHEAKTKRDFSR